MILHTHFLLHLYLVSIFLDYLSLINKKSRIERDNPEKSKKDTEDENIWKRLRKKLRRPLLYYQDRELLGIGCITCANRRYLVGILIAYGIQSVGQLRTVLGLCRCGSSAVGHLAVST